MKSNALSLLIGLFGLAISPFVAAGGSCSAAKSPCAVEDVTASRIEKPDTTGSNPVVESVRPIDFTPRIAPIWTTPAGQNYGRWAAQWYQWVLGIPAARNPLTDPTGENCAQRQVDEVWFLAGSSSSDPVVRTCEVPVGRSLFFPLINILYGAFLNDAPETRTEEFVRAAGSCSEPAQITVWIDRMRVPLPTSVLHRQIGQPIATIQRPNAAR